MLPPETHSVGGSLDIFAAWQKAVTDGAVTIDWKGTPPTGTGIDPATLVKAIFGSSPEPFMDSMFKPASDLKPPVGTAAKGKFIGVTLAFAWTHETDAKNVQFDMNFEGVTWLPETMSATITDLMSPLDNSYYQEINAESEIAITSVLFGDSTLIDGGLLGMDVVVDGIHLSGTEAPRNLDLGNLSPGAPTKSDKIDTVVSCHDPKSLSITFNLSVIYAGGEQWGQLTVT